MGNDSPDLGKGLFGYRKSAVNQIIADRDIMLRQAEGRVRAAEAKVAELENDLSSFRDRNARMDEQLERLRSQLEVVLRRTEADSSGPEGSGQGGAPESTHADYEEGFVAEHGLPAGERFPSEDLGYQARATAPTADVGVEPQAYGGGSAEETVAALLPEAATPPPSAPRENLQAWVNPPSSEEYEISDPASSDEGGPQDEGQRPPTDEPPWMTRLAEQRRPPQANQDVGTEDVPYQTPASSGWVETVAPQAQAPFQEEPHMTQVAPEPPQGPPEPEWTAPPPPPAPPQAPPQAPHPPPAPPQASAPPPAPPQAPEPYRYESQFPPPPPPPAAREPAHPRDDVTSRFLTEELAGILAAAEESAARIVERARASTQRQIMESNRLWREVQAEVARFASWRDQVEPVIRQVQSKVDSVRGLVDDVPDRIRQALAPMADAISSIDVDMAELASALTPPLLLTPSGFEDEGQSWLSRASQTNPEFDATEAESLHGQDERPYEGGDAPGPFGAEAG
jgi:hypothetical protein